MVTLEELKKRLKDSNLELSVKDFDADVVAESFYNDSGMWSDNITLDACYERCISWYANECANIEELLLQRTRNRLAEQVKEWDKKHSQFVKLNG